MDEFKVGERTFKQDDKLVYRDEDGFSIGDVISSEIKEMVGKYNGNSIHNGQPQEEPSV